MHKRDSAVLFSILNWVGVKLHRKKQPNIEWQSILESLKSDLDDFQYYLDTRKKGLIELSSANEKNTKKGVLGIVATVSHKYEKPFETKEPIEFALNKLNSNSNYNVHMLVSRNPKTFYGYYLYVSNYA